VSVLPQVVDPMTPQDQVPADDMAAQASAMLTRGKIG